MDYHQKYHHLILESQQNNDNLSKIKQEGPTILCKHHKNEPITSFCNKCKCYLCFECQMDHLDHAKGNLQNALEQVLFKKFAECTKTLQNKIEDCLDLESKMKDILNK